MEPHPPRQIERVPSTVKVTPAGGTNGVAVGTGEGEEVETRVWDLARVAGAVGGDSVPDAGGKFPSGGGASPKTTVRPL